MKNIVGIKTKFLNWDNYQKENKDTVLIKNEKEKDQLDKKIIYESDCQEMSIKDQLKKMQYYID